MSKKIRRTKIDGRDSPANEDPTEELLDNLQKEATIQSALLALLPSTSLRVDVDAENGIIYLRGEVASKAQKQAAERVVKRARIPGIKRIENELIVNPKLPPLPHP